MISFDQQYQALLKRVLEEGSAVQNQRTGHTVRAVPSASITIDLAKDGFPLLALREIPIRLFVAEQIWFIAGCRKPSDFLETFSQMWTPFTDEHGDVTAAYGYRWRTHFGRDQLAGLIQLLEHDASSRHGVVVMWDPALDGLGGPPQKNVPCPFSFVVNVLDGRLNLSTMMRSNDLIVGLPYDVAGFALLQCLLAQRLGLLPGVYTHFISYPEIYDVHSGVAKELIQRTSAQQPIQLILPPEALRRAEQKDTQLVHDIVQNFTQQYTPCDAIPGIQVVV